MATEPPTVHIVEPNPTGHRLWLVGWLLAAPPPGWRCVVHTTGAGCQHPLWRELPRAVLPRLGLTLIPRVSRDPPPQRWAQLRHHWRKSAQIDRHLRRHVRAGDRVFIPYVDDLVLALAVWPHFLHGMDLSVLAMRDAAHYAELGIAPASRAADLRDRLVRRWLDSGRLRSYASNQRPFCRWAQRHWPGRRPRFIPDPAAAEPGPDRASACRALGLDPGRRWILCFGGLTPRKGIAELLRWRRDPAWPAATGVICAGRCDAAITRLFAEQDPADPGLDLRPGFVDSRNERLLFTSCDLVWLVYRGHLAMSGCLIQAGLHRRPVSTCPEGMIGWHNKRLGLGPIIRPAASAAEAGAAVAAWLDDPARCHRAGDRGRRAFADHAPDHFRQRVWRALGIVGSDETAGPPA